MKKWMKRSIGAVMASAMIAGSVCLFDANYVQHAEAKETLESIKKVVAETTPEAPYTILEVVPDVSVSSDVLIKNFKDESYRISSLSQSLGVIGYYIGGQEPSVVDAAKKFTELQYYLNSDTSKTYTGLNDTALRKSYIEAVTAPLKEDAAHVVTVDETQTDYPIYYSDYKEYCEGDYNLTEDVKAKIADGTYQVIPFNYTGENNEAAHLDRMYGYMKHMPDGSGKFIYRYLRVPETDPLTTDYATEFLNGTDMSSEKFTKVSDATGEFDPHFVRSEGQAYAYYAKFGKAEGSRCGYVIESAQVWDTEHQGEVGTPVYTAAASDSVSDNTVGSELSYAGKVQDDAGTKVVKNDEEETISGEGMGPFYMPIFSYTDTPGDGAVLYQVIDYGKGSGSTDYVNQYALDTATPLVPNMAGKGTVKVSAYTDWNDMTDANLIYDYLPDGGGNYNFTSTPETYGVTLSYYCIRGAKIYFFTGYNNREWMKQYSFDRDPAECAGLKVQVNTKIALATDPDLSDADITGAKLIMLSNPNASLVIGGDDSYTKYGFTPSGDGAKKHDITGLQMIQILARVTQSNIPIISDYSIISDADGMADAAAKVTAQKSMMYRLAQALTLEDVSVYFNAFYHETEERLQSDAAKPSDNGTMMDANEYHFVNKNVYVYNMKAPAAEASPQRVPFLNRYYYSEIFGETAVNDGFGEVLLDIENENLYRETDGGHAALSTNISEAVAIRYIIGYGKKRAFNTKGTMRILEIEPCNSFDLSASGNDGILYITKNNKKEELINQSETKIVLTKMTTAEFIGKIEDLNSLYDMIYIGENVGLMNTDSTTGETRYNDTSMNGLIYCNVGDYIYGQPVMAGLLADDYVDGMLKGKYYVKAGGETSRYRYSGNDITKDKASALKDYVAAGYPVVVADDFIQSQTTATGKVQSVNLARIDRASYMYEFMNEVKDKRNVFRLENLSSALFNWYLNLSKPSITLYGKASDSANNSYVLQKDVYDGLYHTEYELSLMNNGAADSNSTFDCKLFVDINADGKFSKTTEQLTNFVVNNHDGSEAAKDGGRYQLRTNAAGTPDDQITRYMGICKLSEAYTGILPWQLVVTQNENESRRMVTKGYYEIRNTKEDIKVLQIDTSGEHDPSTWNMDVTSKADGTFKDLLESDQVPFNVDITTISATAYNEKATTEAEYLTFLESYDMLVLGFSDCYGEGNATAMSAIRQYIENGHSVLFTHDTTSFINTPESQFKAQDYYNRGRWRREIDLHYGGYGYASATHWGYEFNSKIRGLVGMDRYGILGNSDKKERAYVPKSERERDMRVRDIQGMTYSTLNSFRYTGNDNDGNALSTYKNLKGIDTGSGQYAKEFVTQVNSGQLTTYPYKLNPNFPVANTHGQYYQLDLAADDDGDGESDIVVWYCIGGTTDPKVSDSVDLYALSPNDVRNNYYIYNKGNITYSGVGHSKVMELSGDRYVPTAIDAQTGQRSDQEIRLFINTLVAAYRAGLHAPDVTIYENYKASSRKIDNIYVSYDSQLKSMENGGMLDETEDLYFSARSVSLIQSTINTTQNMTAKVYYEDETSGSVLKYGDEDVHVKEVSLDSNLWYYDATTATEHVGLGTDITSGVVYKTKIPVTILKSSENQVRMFVVVTQTLKNTTTQKVTTVTGDDTASLVRVQMFNLE